MVLKGRSDGCCERRRRSDLLQAAAVAANNGGGCYKPSATMLQGGRRTRRRLLQTERHHAARRPANPAVVLPQASCEGRRGCWHGSRGCKPDSTSPALAVRECREERRIFSLFFFRAGALTRPNHMVAYSLRPLFDVVFY
jgi:hypothetical protein